MPRVVKQPDIMQVILDLQKRIRILENSPRLTAASITTNGNSALKVFNSSGTEVAAIGDLAGSAPGTVIPGFAVYRPNGTPGLVGAASSPVSQFGIQDNSANVVCQTNETTGFGLQSPAISFPMYANTVASWPSTTGAVAVPLLQGFAPVTHSRYSIQGFAFCPTGTTGEVSLQVDGVAVGSPVSIPTNTIAVWSYVLQAMNTGLGFDSLSNLVVYGRAVTGAGAISVSVVESILVGS